VSNSEQEAAANIRKFLGGLKGLLALEPGLESLGSVKQATNEAKSRLTKLQGEEAELTRRLTAALAGIEEATEKAERSVAHGVSAANEIRRSAQVEADRLALETKEGADRIVADARSRAADMDAALANKRAVLNDMNKEIAAAQARLDNINRQLADLRAKL
jgi:chromosome segregation ATPase